MVGTLRFAHPTALRAGAFGYVDKGGDPGIIVAAVRTVAQGRKDVTTEIEQMLVESLSQEAMPGTTERTGGPGGPGPAAVRAVRTCG